MKQSVMAGCVPRMIVPVCLSSDRGCGEQNYRAV